MTWRYRRVTLTPMVRGSEIGEPASWILAIIALSIALGGVSALTPSFYTGPFFAGILLGFVAHELAHRQVGRRYGAKAEFVAFTPGLLITLISGFLPFKILAPGYVKVITWRLSDPRGLFYSVAAGPATNIVLAILLIAASLAYAPTWAWYLRVMAYVNAYLAIFNLIPIAPLDGEKIMRYDLKSWMLLMALALASYAATRIL